MPDDEIAAMLGDNAAEFYGFEVEKLAPLVERMGPEKSWFRDETQGDAPRATRTRRIENGV